MSTDYRRYVGWIKMRVVIMDRVSYLNKFGSCGRNLDDPVLDFCVAIDDDDATVCGVVYFPNPTAGQLVIYHIDIEINDSNKLYQVIRSLGGLCEQHSCDVLILANTAVFSEELAKQLTDEIGFIPINTSNSASKAMERDMHSTKPMMVVVA